MKKLSIVLLMVIGFVFSISLYTEARTIGTSIEVGGETEEIEEWSCVDFKYLNKWYKSCGYNQEERDYEKGGIIKMKNREAKESQECGVLKYKGEERNVCADNTEKLVEALLAKKEELDVLAAEEKVEKEEKIEKEEKPTKVKGLNGLSWRQDSTPYLNLAPYYLSGAGYNGASGTSIAGVQTSKVIGNEVNSLLGTVGLGYGGTGGVGGIISGGYKYIFGKFGLGGSTLVSLNPNSTGKYGVGAEIALLTEKIGFQLYGQYSQGFGRYQVNQVITTTSATRNFNVAVEKELYISLDTVGMSKYIDLGAYLVRHNDSRKNWLGESLDEQSFGGKIAIYLPFGSLNASYAINNSVQVAFNIPLDGKKKTAKKGADKKEIKVASVSTTNAWLKESNVYYPVAQTSVQEIQNLVPSSAATGTGTTPVTAAPGGCSVVANGSTKIDGVITGLPAGTTARWYVDEGFFSDGDGVGNPNFTISDRTASTAYAVSVSATITGSSESPQVSCGTVTTAATTNAVTAAPTECSVTALGSTQGNVVSTGLPSGATLNVYVDGVLFGKGDKADDATFKISGLNVGSTHTASVSAKQLDASESPQVSCGSFTTEVAAVVNNALAGLTVSSAILSIGNNNGLFNTVTFTVINSEGNAITGFSISVDNQAALTAVNGPNTGEVIATAVSSGVVIITISKDGNSATVNTSVLL